MIFISTLSLIELKLTVVPKIDQTDKIVHFLFHFFLSGLLMLHLVYEKKYKINKKTYYFVFLFSLVYGLSIEGLQAVVSLNRKADFYDVLANTTGSLMFLLFFSYFSTIKRQ